MASEGGRTTRLRAGAAALALLAVVGGGAAFAVSRAGHSSPRDPGARGGEAAGGGAASAEGGRNPGAGATSTTASTTTTLPPAVVLTGVTPRNGASGVRYRQPVLVSFSQPLAPESPHPALSPSVPGSWTRVSSATWRFDPAANYPPLQHMTVTVPGGEGGVTDAQGVTLAKSVHSAFEVAGPTVLRLQQLLAELDYLPLSFVPQLGGPPASLATGAGTSGTAPSGTAPSGTAPSVTAPSVTAPSGTAPTGTGPTGTGGSARLDAASPSAKPATGLVAKPAASPAAKPAAGRSASLPAGIGGALGAVGIEARRPGAVELAARPGRFVWRWARIPSQLAAQWSPGGWNVVTEGAVMAFEYASGLDPDGQPGPRVWNALLSAVAHRQVDPNPYDYLIVSETEPETLYVWRDGAVVYQTLANTGVTGAVTQLGTFPVYLRYTVTTMSGTNPDGSHYVDPGIPWVSYFNGSDAVHGFVRPGYGYPQSDGCVELPVSNAATVYPMDNYGTLVTVTTGDLSAELGVPPLQVDWPPAPPSTTTTTPAPAKPPAHQAPVAVHHAAPANGGAAAAQRAAALHTSAVQAAARAAAARAAAAQAAAARAAAARAAAARAAAARAAALRAAATRHAAAATRASEVG